jgi:hypothetical protein
VTGICSPTAACLTTTSRRPRSSRSGRFSSSTGSAEVGRRDGLSPDDDQRVDLVFDSPSLERAGTSEELRHDGGRTGSSGSAWKPEARVVKRDGAVGADVRMPNLPVLSTRLGAVITIDEHEIGPWTGPPTPNVLAARNVPADVRTAAPSSPRHGHTGGPRRRPPPGPQGPAGLVDEWVDEVKLGRRRERVAEHPG